MATEDERYRQSSQYRLWSFSPSSLLDLREKTNSLAKRQIAARLDATPDFLTPAEEAELVKFFTVELIRAAHFCGLPTEIRSTAAVFLRRFYVTNSVMTYPPTEMLKISIFFGCKAESFFFRLSKLAETFPNTTGEQIVAGEFLLCQGIRFAFDVRHPFRGLEGAILELRRKLPDEKKRIDKAFARAREILKFSALVTDAYFHYTPSQILMASILMVDSGLIDVLIPKPEQSGSEGTDGESEARRKTYDMIITTLEKCRAMLEEEPPEMFTEYWSSVSLLSESFWASNMVTKLLQQSMTPLRKKLQRCRDPDRIDLMALQRARREQAVSKVKQPKASDDGSLFGSSITGPDLKRRKVEVGANSSAPPA